MWWHSSYVQKLWGILCSVFQQKSTGVVLWLGTGADDDHTADDPGTLMLLILFRGFSSYPLKPRNDTQISILRTHSPDFKSSRTKGASRTFIWPLIKESLMKDLLSFAVVLVWQRLHQIPSGLTPHFPHLRAWTCRCLAPVAVAKGGLLCIYRNYISLISLKIQP